MFLLVQSQTRCEDINVFPRRSRSQNAGSQPLVLQATKVIADVRCIVRVYNYMFLEMILS